MCVTALLHYSYITLQSYLCIWLARYVRSYPQEGARDVGPDLLCIKILILGFTQQQCTETI